MYEQEQRIATVGAAFHSLHEHLDDALPIIAACVKALRQEATNRSYPCRQGRDEPSYVVFIETWQNRNANRRQERFPHCLAVKALREQGRAGSLHVTQPGDVDIQS